MRCFSRTFATSSLWSGGSLSGTCGFILPFSDGRWVVMVSPFQRNLKVGSQGLGGTAQCGCAHLFPACWAQEDKKGQKL